MANNKNQDRLEAVIFVGSGLLAGAGVSATVGGIGLAVAEIAIGIGLIPVAAAGAVVGLAAYGFKKILWPTNFIGIFVLIINLSNFTRTSNCKEYVKLSANT